jgi:phosphomannomutase/phosphoglucomutase
MKMNPTIFREYDIRGVAGADFDADFARGLGRAVGTRVRGLHPERSVTMSVGRDCRLTSDEYAEAMIRGLRETGVDVFDIGMVPTPLLYFSLFELPVDGGIEVTASHNASEYNGFKVCIGRESAYGDAIASLRADIERADFAAGEGRVEKRDVVGPYLTFCEKQFGVLPRRLRVVVDAGNGAASRIAPAVIERLGCEVVPLYCEPDGRFPNHHPDPTLPENLADVIRNVAERRADVGLAFDGDGDRLGVVGPDGRILWGDEILVVFAREILARKPGAVVISEVKCSQRLFDDVAKHGGRPIMWKAGHSLIKAKMKETGAEVGGEMSGHMFFSDRFFGYDDAVYAAARLLEILARTGRSLTELLADLPPAHTTPELRVDCPDAVKFRVVERVRERLRESYPVNDVDGVRAQFADGWGLVRASNTQPALVLRFEAVSAAKRDEYRGIVERIVEEERARLGG